MPPLAVQSRLVDLLVALDYILTKPVFGHSDLASDEVSVLLRDSPDTVASLLVEAGNLLIILLDVPEDSLRYLLEDHEATHSLVEGDLFLLLVLRCASL